VTQRYGSGFAVLERVPWRYPKRFAIILVLVGLGCTGCSGPETLVQQHQEKLESLASTATAIGEAWLAGRVSGTYARTALEETFVLVEQERRSVTRSPRALLDPRAARLSATAERLSRLLALILHDVLAVDASSVRQRLAQIPTVWSGSNDGRGL
jgi:hypothetical protein